MKPQTSTAETAVMSPVAIEAMKQQIAPVVRAALELQICDQHTRKGANEFARAVKERKADVKEFWAEKKALDYRAWKMTCALEEKMGAGLDEAEAALKGKMLAYDQEQERIRLAEERKLQTIADEKARVERQKLEQEAARQRDLQRQREEQAAAARWQADQAEEAERTQLLAEADAADRKAAAAAAKAEQREEVAATIIAPTIQIAGPEKMKGESTRKMRKGRLIDKQLLIQAAAGGNELAASFLSFDQTAANRFAAAVKGAIHTPGIEWYEEPVLAIGGI